ncbi:MAG TPA: putative zinc-binding metallopeptidase [Cyclobacteriaceae bacterium]|jgi:hypothetical protein|nr:putative zinc-binding metallopeptidase [Cyclobacteriaceae bacterium]HRF35416.1 putative zinc-binding metallopeptidase [Cyclobacteriaceae bacterium]
MKKLITQSIIISCAILFGLSHAFGQPENLTRHNEELISIEKISEIDSTLSNRLERIQSRYDLQLYVQQKTSGISIADTVKRGYLSYHLIDTGLTTSRNKLLQIFAEEWEKYPEDFIRQSNLKSIVFVSTLAVNGQNRYAMPDARFGRLYFDVAFVNRNSDRYLRHSIHHEFHHLVQYKAFNDFYYKDPSWISFNKKNFKYGSGGASAYAKPNYSRKIHPEKGFVTGYATYGVEEDMAELFGYAMTTSEFPMLLKWIKRDKILAKKFAYLLGMLSVQSKQFNSDYLLKIHIQADVH